MGTYEIIFKNSRQKFLEDSYGPQEALKSYFSKAGKKVEIKIGTQQKSNVRVTLTSGKDIITI